MHWLIAAPFSRSATDQWLGKFVPGRRHEFESVVASYAHDRSRARTGLGGWLDYLGHARAALRQIPRSRAGVGLITCFPQLPTLAGLLCRLTFRRVPSIAWAFNLGSLPGGLRQKFSRWALSPIDLFVVHSRAEIDECSRWLGFPSERFRFVPLQCPTRTVTVPEDVAAPYIVAMGSANRDYALLFDVVREAGYRTVVIAGPHAVAGLDVPPNVEVASGLTLEDCHRLLQGARVSVVPVANDQTASGQVTLLDSMAFGRPTIVTRCPGSVDYIVEGETALAVTLGDRADMRRAIDALWNDPALRDRLSEGGRRYAEAHFSDEAVGVILGQVCDALEDQQSRRTA